MRYFSVLAGTTAIAVVSASAVISSQYYDLDFPVLHRRMIHFQKGRVKKKADQLPGHVLAEGPKKTRPDSPMKEGDTRVSAKVTGPGQVAVGREKHHPQIRSGTLAAGQPQQLETHDAQWSKAEAQAIGPTPSNAGRQNALLHPAKVEGSGMSGHVEVKPPDRYGYGKLKKTVSGQVVRDERIPAGAPPVEDSHVGSRPHEVQYEASSSRGGEVSLQVNNVKSNTQARLQNPPDQ